MHALAVRSALRERNVRYLVATAAVDALGNNMTAVGLAFAVLQIGSTADLGYVFLAAEIPSVIFLLAGGVWADRVSPKTLLVLGYLAAGSAQAGTALLFMTDHATVWRVALLQLAFGIPIAFIRPASTSLVAQAVSHEHLQQANALLNLSRSTLQIVGPALGGLIVVLANPAWALAVDALTFFVGAALQLRLRIAATERPPRTPMLHELREGWNEFTSRTWLWMMVGSFALYQLTLFPALFVLGPTVAKSDLGGAGAWALILAFRGVGSVCGGLVALSLHPSRPLLATALLCVPMALLLALLGYAAPVSLLCVASFVGALGLTCASIIWFTTFQLHVPDYLMSRLSSFDWFGSVALNPLGFVLIGPLASAFGVATTLYLAATLNAVVSIVVASTPAIRRLPRRPAVESVGV